MSSSRPLIASRTRCALADPDDRRRAKLFELLGLFPDCVVVEQASTLEDLETIYGIDDIDIFVLDWELVRDKPWTEISTIVRAAGPGRCLLLVPFEVLARSDELSHAGSPCIGRPDHLGGAESLCRQILANAKALKVIRAIEEGQRQSQKMEALGRLAAGVAHDFNNLLTIISGYSCDMLIELPEDHAHHEGLTQIQEAARRAATLTRQLLAFSRKQVLRPRVIDLNSIIGDLAKMLRRLVGDAVELSLELGEELGSVHADPSQIEQVVTNLVANARDAMPGGGHLTIATVDSHQAGELVGEVLPDVGPGHVVLTVTDTGTGMDLQTISRIFDPFFTTKKPGQGTGLGLSTVAGIVRQSGGQIHVQSTVGQGTRFIVLLPRVDGDGQEAEESTFRSAPRGGSETILIVEDSDSLRAMVASVLKKAGYSTLVAGAAEQALQVAAACPSPIALLLTDVHMPGINGRELAARLLSTHPELKVLLMSGTTAELGVEVEILLADVPLLEKPFTSTTLLREVRSMLDRR